MKRTVGLAAGVLLFCVSALGQASVPENQQTAYIYVDGARGSDSNPGSQSNPLATINKAGQIALQNNQKKIGSRVIINPGTYRESITLAASGKETSVPITFQAAVNGTVLISGADVWTGWQPYPKNAKIFSHAWPYKWGLCALPSGWPAARDIVRRREMILVNGTSLTQVLSFSHLSAGRFYVDEATARVYLWPPGGTDLRTTTVEVAIRPDLLKTYGITNMVLRGLTFQNANSCLSHSAVVLAPSDSASSENILVEDSNFLWNNWAGIEVSASSNVTVRRGVANHNGGAGMYGYQIKSALYEDVEGSYNDWRGAMGDYDEWDPAGAKFMHIHNGTFRRWKAIGNHAPGLWFDTDNADITVEKAFLVQNKFEGILLEANQGPITLKDSKICGNGRGIHGYNSSYTHLTGNTIYGNKAYQINISGKPGGRREKNWETGKTMILFTDHWTISRNIIVGASSSQFVIQTDLPENDWRRFVTTLVSNDNHWYNASKTDAFQLPGGSIDLARWRAATRQDGRSVFERPSVNLDQECRAP